MEVRSPLFIVLKTLGGQGNLVTKLGQMWGDVERLGTELEELWMIPCLMTHLVASLEPDSANSCMMQGASYTQRKISMVLFVLPSILLLVVIVVTVVIVVVISVVVVVVAIVGVVIVVVGSSVPSINKLSFVIVGSFSCYWSFACPGVPISIVGFCHVSNLCFQSSNNTISN
ncbi:hypothetical protein Tco_0717271 [Tanacetum coccineum]